MTGSRARFVGMALLLLVGLQFAFLGAKILVFAVPNDRIVASLAQALDAEEWNSAGIRSDYGGNIDRWTECIELTEGLGEVAGANLVERALADASFTDDGCPRAIEAVQRAASGGSVEAFPYLRYWHGYSVVTRPALALYGVTGVRVVLGLLLIVAVVLYVRAFVRRLGWLAGVLAVLPILATTDAFGWTQAVGHAVDWTVLFAGATFTMWATQRWALRGAVVGPMVAGACYAFVDLLTNPPAAVILTAAAALTAIAVSGAGATLRRAWAVAGLAFLSWFVGWAVTWAAKWAFAAMAFGVDAVRSDVEGSIAQRLSGTDDSVIPRFGVPTDVNLHWWLDHMPLARSVLVLSCVGIALVLVACLALRRGRPLWFLPYAAVATFPIAWYEILSNHSQIHYWFTYRAIPAALSVLLIGTVVAARMKRPDSPRAVDLESVIPPS